MSDNSRFGRVECQAPTGADRPASGRQIARSPCDYTAPCVGTLWGIWSNEPHRDQSPGACKFATSLEQEENPRPRVHPLEPDRAGAGAAQWSYLKTRVTNHAAIRPVTGSRSGTGNPQTRA